MDELFDRLEHQDFDAVRERVLLDTCFLIWMAEHHKLDKLESLPIATTSFNLEELAHVTHHLHDDIKVSLRNFLKKTSLLVLTVPVHPGDLEGEKRFVSRLAPELLEIVPDPSDAVLAAVALATSSNLLTKDKHHLFTTQLEHFFNARGIKVWKELKDAQVKHTKAF
jgi:predicted nucleic acid-binding protein